MALDILITIVVTSFIQSIFGVGVLLFGTPLLLLLGYGFIESVVVLLPISVAINLVQIAKDYRSVDLDFCRGILIYTVPFVVVFLLVVATFDVNIGVIVGIFLLFAAAKDFSRHVDRSLKYVVRYEKAYFVVMGIIHGLTNLGGSLLTAIVHSKEYEKHVTRVTVAVAYATFAVFQILTLVGSGHSFGAQLSGIGIYMAASLAVFLLTERMVYMEIKADRYTRYFAAFLFLSGIVLCVKSI